MAVAGTAEEFVQYATRPILNALFLVAPSIIRFCKASHAAYKKLPMMHVRLIAGTILCFFGGFYPTFFAALQAAEHGGLDTVGRALSALSEEVIIIVNENEKDDKVDANKNGKADVVELDGGELLRRKVKLVLTKMNPEKVNDALATIYKVWISVLAVLTIQFARTIALALTLSDFSKKFADRALLPIVERATPKEYRRWCPVLLDWLCKSIGISIAWKIQTVLSAFASAMAGGLIMSRAMLHVFFKGRKDHEETNVDELASCAFAAIGFYFQYSRSFAVPFPLNFFLLPVELADHCIRWVVTK